MRERPVRRTGRLVIQPQILVSDLEAGLPDDVKTELLEIVEPKLLPASWPQTLGQRLARTMLEYPRIGNFYEALQALNVSEEAMKYVVEVRNRDGGYRVEDRLVGGGADWTFDTDAERWLYSPLKDYKDVTLIAPPSRTLGIDLKLHSGSARERCGAPAIIQTARSPEFDRAAVYGLALHVAETIKTTIGGSAFLRSHPLAGIAVIVATLDAVLASPSLHRKGRSGVVVRADLYWDALCQLELGEHFETVRRLIEAHRPDHIPLEVPWQAGPAAQLKSAALLNKKNGSLVLHTPTRSTFEARIGDEELSWATDIFGKYPDASKASHRSNYDNSPHLHPHNKEGTHRSSYDGYPNTKDGTNKTIHRSSYDGETESLEETFSFSTSTLSAPVSDPSGLTPPTGPAEWALPGEPIEEVRAALDPRAIERAFFELASDQTEFGIVYNEILGLGLVRPPSRGQSSWYGHHSIVELAKEWSAGFSEERRIAIERRRISFQADATKKYKNAASVLERYYPGAYARVLRAMVDGMPLPALPACSRLVKIPHAVRGLDADERTAAIEQLLTTPLPYTKLLETKDLFRYGQMATEVQQKTVAVERLAEKILDAGSDVLALREHIDQGRASRATLNLLEKRLKELLALIGSLPRERLQSGERESADTHEGSGIAEFARVCGSSDGVST